MIVDPYCTITACVFDAYGTIFDVATPVSRNAAQLGDKGAKLVDLWRRKQLEYTWLRSMMNRHADFWKITEESLDFALEALDVSGEGLRDKLLQAYRTMDPFPDAVKTLTMLKENGFERAILSNGTPEMLQTAVHHAGMDSLISRLLSVESVGCYKPDPTVYRFAVQGLDVPPDRVLFISANGWDIAGAASYGLRTVWVNRHGLPVDRLSVAPFAQIRSLTELTGLLRLPR